MWVGGVGEGGGGGEEGGVFCLYSLSPQVCRRRRLRHVLTCEEEERGPTF
jgi:hypothetical protein